MRRITRTDCVVYMTSRAAEGRRTERVDGLHTSAVGVLHERLVAGRRVRVLSDWFARMAPEGSRILDVGCGDGSIAALLKKKRPDVSVTGIDVLARERSRIAVQTFDGAYIPFDAGSFDVALLCDVLHHTEDPTVLLREAVRVAKQVLIKDHFREGNTANVRLRFMDWAGNSRFGVALPFNYWRPQQWSAAWQQLGLQPETVETRLGLYPPPIDWFFGAKLHFIALLGKASHSAEPADGVPAQH